MAPVSESIENKTNEGRGSAVVVPKYEKTLVAILFVTWGTVFLDRMSQLYLAPYIAPEFHLTHEQVGELASALAIAWAVSTFFFGALSDRLGRKVILVPAVFAFSVLSWISGLARSFEQLLAIRALMGIAEGPTWSILTALIEESSPKSRRGRNVGVVVSAAALVGLAIAPVLSTQVAARWGWRWAFFVAGLPGLVMGILLWRFVKEPERNGAALSESDRESGTTLRGYLSLLRYRNIWLCCAAAAGFMSWLFLINVFAPLYITEVAKQPATTAGFLLGASGLGSFFIGVAFPAMSDRVGRKPILMLLAVMSAAVPLVLLSRAMYEHAWVLAAILFAMNSGQALASLIMVLVPTESVPAQYAATSIGLASLVGEIFGATGAPILGGAFAERYGLGVTMWMAAAGSAVILLMAMFLKQKSAPTIQV